MLSHTCPICGGNATIDTSATTVTCHHVRCRRVTAYPYQPIARPVTQAGDNRLNEPHGDR